MIRTGNLEVSFCPLLSDLSFLHNLTSASRLRLTGLAGSLTMNQLTSCGDIAFYSSTKTISASFKVLTQINGRLYIWNCPQLAAHLGGLYIFNNDQLVSLAALQNLSTLPVLYIAGNAALNQFCPLKGPASALSNLPDLSYQVPNLQFDGGRPVTKGIATLTLTGNGSYATTTDALAAVLLCQ